MVLGLCIVGGVYIFVMVDESVMVKGNGIIFFVGFFFVKVSYRVFVFYVVVFFFIMLILN